MRIILIFNVLNSFIFKELLFNQLFWHLERFAAQAQPQVQVWRGMKPLQVFLTSNIKLMLSVSFTRPVALSTG
jgi:hypothetical protein